MDFNINIYIFTSHIIIRDSLKFIRLLKIFKVFIIA